jgi:transcriptional regulator with XRE-family HTH domain
MATARSTKLGPRRGRAEAFDRHVGARILQRRRTLGLTRQRLAELIAVTQAQTYRYERGANRISAGQLYHVARALDVGIDYFFEGIESGEIPSDELIPQGKLMLKLARNFLAIPVRRHQEEIVWLARALAEPHPPRERVQDAG